jgi:hypothetical protein
MKKKQMIALLICLLSISHLPAQQTTYFRTKADSLRAVGDLNSAIDEYAKLYAEDSTNRHNTYNYACALALSNQKDNAFYYVNIATAKDTSVKALTDPDFYFLIYDDRWTALQNKLIERVEAKYGKYENLELSRELWTMKIKDQAFYYHLNIAGKIPGQTPLVTDAIWELKRLINEENIQRLSEIVDAYGWPKKSVVKGSAATAAFLVVQHADLEMQKKYLPLIKEAAENGEADLSSLALLIDRINIREGKKQIYGSQITINSDGTYQVDDLFEPEYVNQRRKKMGLRPIEDYVKNWGIEWNIKQKEK